MLLFLVENCIETNKRMQVTRQPSNYIYPSGIDLCLVDGDINLYTSLNGNVENLAKHLRGCVEVNETLVNAHLVEVPGLGTFTIWCLTSVDS